MSNSTKYEDILLTTPAGINRQVRVNRVKAKARINKVDEGTYRHPGGRPSAYRAEYAEQARKLCLLMGAEDKHLAEVFGVSERTINRWKKAYPEFCQSIRAGKLIADANVAARLYDRAIGMKVVKTHFARHEVHVAAIEYVKELPPDVKAMSLWLRNRQGGHWQETPARAEQDGGAFSIVIHHELHPDDQRLLDLTNSEQSVSSK